MEDMIRGLPHDYYYSFTGVVVEAGAPGQELRLELPSGSTLRLDPFVGEALTDEFQPLLGKTLKVTDAWLHGGYVWLTNTPIEVSEVTSPTP
jgi:hypothetical protein